MLNKEGNRALAYTARCGKIEKIEGADNIELMSVLGWKVIVKIGEFHEGDLCIYFEIDSKLPEKEWSEFMRSKHFKVKTMKLGKFGVISQGLALPINVFGVEIPNEENVDVTELLEVTYAVEEDNVRKGKVDPNAKYRSMAARKPNIFKKSWARWMMKREWGRKVMFFFFGKKKDNSGHGWPVGKFPGVSKTDQERCENMSWILNDKTPFIVTQKCDGSSGTYILEKVKRNKFEFYVCSRNVRMIKPEQECFYGDRNYYWEVAIKYDIENKMKDYLEKNPDISFVCWQGEICAPGIQKNPHRLSNTHFYAFHMTDSKTGRYDIRDAKRIWDSYDIEVVPIVCDDYVMPDDFEDFKLSADGYYDSSVCEGNKDCQREGFVYYKTTDPSFSFKNVSRQYLLKHGQ